MAYWTTEYRFDQRLHYHYSSITVLVWEPQASSAGNITHGKSPNFYED